MARIEPPTDQIDIRASREDVHNEGLTCSVEVEPISFMYLRNHHVISIQITSPRGGGICSHNLDAVAGLTASDARDLRDKIDEALRKIGEH
jgi:hypothetical protein